ncbi:MAG: hypothetical protein KIT57_03620 [Blastocatellales bacterium]|nr:hypothetical protein [Blastocatellales bacterium]
MTDETLELPFNDRQEVADWIDANQLGRRNLKPDQMTLLRGRRYNRMKAGRGGDRKSKGQIVPLNTAESLAEQYGVSERTIKRDGQFAAAVEALAMLPVKMSDSTLPCGWPGNGDLLRLAPPLDGLDSALKSLLLRFDSEQFAADNVKLPVHLFDADADLADLLANREDSGESFLPDWPSLSCAVLGLCFESRKARVYGVEPREDALLGGAVAV